MNSLFRPERLAPHTHRFQHACLVFSYAQSERVLMLYLLYLEDDPTVSKKIRAEKLDAHLAYLDQHRNIILLGGAMLAEDGVTRVGSALVLNVAGHREAEAFSENEPFRRAGLYASVRIRRMRRAQWRPDIAPSTPDG